MQLIPSPQQQYALTPEELKLAQTYNSMQLAQLCNIRAEAVTLRLALEYDASDPQGLIKFMQQEAYQKGRIDVINTLIEDSQTAAVNQ